jgi:hypothetical protein
MAETAHLADLAATAAGLFTNPRGINFFPVRHHSPACAFHLRAALRELCPAAVLIEGPVDFATLIPEVLAPGVVPPVAMVALPSATERAAGAGAGVTYYPLCSHSPEFVALQEGYALGAQIRFIDLPSRHRAMRGDRAESEAAPLLPMRETPFDRGAYVEALCRATGYRDGQALWDGLFEARARGGDWRTFFASVGAYCAALRAVSAEDDLAVDGTLARETMMRSMIAAARSTVAGPIAVVTGGFHTQALLFPPDSEAPFEPPEAKSQVWLTRYDFRALDRLNGYAAGLPLPGFYDRLWQRLISQEGETPLAEQVFTGFRAHLAANEPTLAFSFPTLRAMVETARRLATLRDLAEPGRVELFDALQSAGIKDEIESGHAPLLAAFTSYLQGERLGDLPAGSRLPPLVEQARRAARAAGFSLADALPKNRELDIYRKPRHRQASRFLHAMRIIATSFAERLSGPDMVHGFKADMLIETWRYAWSPAVEAALIERATDGDSVSEAAAAVLLRALDTLEKGGRRNDAHAVVNLLAVAFDAGLGLAATRLVAAAAEAAGADSEIGRITGGLVVAHALESRAARLVAEGVEEPLAGLLPPLVNELVRRLAALLPDLAVVGKDNAAPAVAALASIAEFLTSSSPGVDATPLRSACERLLSVRLDPAVHGAMIALATLAGLIDEIDAGRRLSAALAGISLIPGDAMRTVSGVMAVAPHLVVRNGEVISAIDRLFGAVDDEGFLALLPELRLCFAELSPSETDQIAAAVAAHHGVGEEQLAQLEGAPDARALAEHLALSERFRRRWSADGLGDWLEEAG